MEMESEPQGVGTAWVILEMIRGSVTGMVIVFRQHLQLQSGHRSSEVSTTRENRTYHSSEFMALFRYVLFGCHHHGNAFVEYEALRINIQNTITTGSKISMYKMFRLTRAPLGGAISSPPPLSFSCDIF